MMNVGKDEASRLGMSEQEMRQAHNVYRAGGVDAYSAAAINQMVPEPSPIERLLATRDSGSMNGSATVDIDMLDSANPRAIRLIYSGRSCSAGRFKCST